MNDRRFVPVVSRVWLFVMVVLVTGSGIGFLFAHAQTFKAPTAPAPDNATLNQLTDLSSYLRTDAVTPQALQGRLTVGSGLNTAAYLASSNDTVSVLGSAGSATAVPLSTLGVPSAAAYGFSHGSTNSVGVYGYALGSTAVAVAGRTTATGGLAGRFWGNVEVFGNELYVEDSIEAPAVSVSSSSSDAAFESTNGISMDANIKRGLYGDADFRGVVGESSASGNVSVSSGIYADNKADDNDFAGQTAYGIKGITYDATGYAGIFGWSTNGNGVEARVGSISTQAAARGKSSTASSMCSPGSCVSGVYGRGGGWSGYFEGDLKISSGGKLYIGNALLTEAGIAQLIAWCNSGGKTYCPDSFR